MTESLIVIWEAGEYFD